MNPSLQQYVETVFGGEDEFLCRIREDAVRQGLPAIQVPIELGRLLALLVVEMDMQRVLEIGTLFGYSSILMGRALPSNGTLVSLEVNSKHAAIARRNIAEAGLGDKIEVRQGPALTSLSGMHGQSFDLIFIDADKEGYPQYLRHALELTHRRSMIVADNVWRGGKVTDPAGDGDAEAVAQFNRAIARNPRLLSTIIPTRDGADAASISIVLS